MYPSRFRMFMEAEESSSDNVEDIDEFDDIEDTDNESSNDDTENTEDIENISDDDNDSDNDDNNDDNNDDDIENVDEDDDTCLDEDDFNTDDIQTFGRDNGPEQNEYDPKEVESLNKLISSEAQAINEYFDAAKDTNDETLRRLYSDIGREESFHMEQLLYAKSTITGETYMPRDPNVKSEYDELVAMGMDKETAAYTAIDKQSLSQSSNGNVSDETMMEEMAIIEMACVYNQMMVVMCEHYDPKDKNETSVFVEEFIYQEAVENAASKENKDITKIQSPIKFLYKSMIGAINVIKRLSHVISDKIGQTKLRQHAKWQWIKKHGIGDLFASGISMYFYDDNKNFIDTNEPCRYVDLLYRISKLVAQQCGFKLSNQAQHKTIKDPIQFSNIDDGLHKLSSATFIKTKIVINKNNKEAIAREFFGYSDQKVDVATVNRDSGNIVNNSDNVYNRMSVISDITEVYLRVSTDILKALEQCEGDTSSIYHNNRTLWNKSVDTMKKVVSYYNKFLSAFAHDMNVMLRLDKDLINRTRERDDIEQHGGQYEGEDIRATGNMMRPTNEPKFTQRENPIINKTKNLFNRKK